MKWIVTARNSANETYVLTDSLTQGRKMIPNAQSLAYQFPNYQAAFGTKEQLKWSSVKGIRQREYAGLKDWNVEAVNE